MKLEEIPPEGVKIAIVGHGTAGKSSFIQRFFRDRFDPTYYGTPNVHEPSTKELPWADETCSVTCWDTGGEDDSEDVRDRLRNVHVFLFAFSVVDRTTFTLLSPDGPYFDECVGESPDANRILLGLKQDLRDDMPTVKRLREAGTSPVTPEEARDLASELGCCEYVECSSKLRKNVDEVFQIALASLFGLKTAPRKCHVM